MATRISTPARSSLICGLDRHAAVDDGRAQRHVPAVGRTLRRPARRARASGVRISARTGWRAGEKLVLACGAQALEDRQRERRGLAGAGLGGGEEVAALEHEGDGLRLDGRRGGVALLGDGAEEIGRQAEGFEGQAVGLRSEMRLGRRFWRRGCDEASCIERRGPLQSTRTPEEGRLRGTLARMPHRRHGIRGHGGEVGDFMPHQAWISRSDVSSMPCRAWRSGRWRPRGG